MKKYYICGSARVGFRIPVFVEDDRELSDPQKVKYLINNKLQNLEELAMGWLKDRWGLTWHIKELMLSQGLSYKMVAQNTSID